MKSIRSFHIASSGEPAAGIGSYSATVDFPIDDPEPEYVNFVRGVLREAFLKIWDQRNVLVLTDIECEAIGNIYKRGQMYIYFEDYHRDGMGKVVEATEQEWQSLIATAVANRYPIDSCTVDANIFNELYERPNVDLKMSEVKIIEAVVPLV